MAIFLSCWPSNTASKRSRLLPRDMADFMVVFLAPGMMHFHHSGAVFQKATSSCSRTSCINFQLIDWTREGAITKHEKFTSFFHRCVKWKLLVDLSLQPSELAERAFCMLLHSLAEVRSTFIHGNPAVAEGRNFQTKKRKGKKSLTSTHAAPRPEELFLLLQENYK